MHTSQIGIVTNGGKITHIGSHGDAKAWNMRTIASGQPMARTAPLELCAAVAIHNAEDAWPPSRSAPAIPGSSPFIAGSPARRIP